MGFTEDIKELSKRISQIDSKTLNEEATKMSMILPLFQLLGYDVFNPAEFCPEYTADVGIKKGEKVDYAILMNQQPILIIETKAANKKLENHDSQLFRYFVTTPAKVAILTNGIYYKFYTDLEEQNKMDKEPFLEVDFLDLKDSQIVQLEKFQKKYLNVEDILTTASVLKYNTLFKKGIAQQLSNPSNEFVKVFLQPFYKGAKTQSILEKFKAILKNSFQEYINETVNSKLKFALENTSEPVQEHPMETDEEWEALTLIKESLKPILNPEEIFYKQTESYLAILYQNNTRKWICRLNLHSAQKSILFPDENKKEKKYPIQEVSDLATYSDLLIASAKRYLQPKTKPKEKPYLKTKWGIYEMPNPYTIEIKKGPRNDLKEIKS